MIVVIRRMEVWVISLVQDALTSFTALKTFC